jgi:1-acyl-sn-glycerol-3-phosphate acyltransferase
LWVFGIRVEARGPHADQGEVFPGRDARGVGRIFIANHQSGVDIPVLLSVIAAHAISRHDLATWPLIGAGGRRIGTLFVDRESRRSGATVLRHIADALAVGEGILMFPEGTAFPGNGVHEFKPGAFNAAHRSDAEIIPIGVAYGSPDAYYFKEPFLQHMKRIGSRRRLLVAVEFGAPLQPSVSPGI